MAEKIAFSGSSVSDPRVAGATKMDIRNDRDCIACPDMHGFGVRPPNDYF